MRGRYRPFARRERSKLHRRTLTPELDLEVDLVVDAQHEGDRWLHQAKCREWERRCRPAGHRVGGYRSHCAPGDFLRDAVQRHVADELEADDLRPGGVRKGSWETNRPTRNEF